MCNFEKEGNTVDDPDWHLSFAIPEKHTFFQAVQDSIETGLVTPRAKRGLIQVLRTLIIQHTKYPSRDEYNVVCKKLIEKYPKLHDGGQSGCVSVMGVLNWWGGGIAKGTLTLSLT